MIGSESRSFFLCQFEESYHLLIIQAKFLHSILLCNILDKSTIDKSREEEEMIEIQDLLYQLRLSEQASTQLFEKRLGISLTRYQMLLFLLENSPCNQMAVQERLKIDQAALTRHFKILEKEGLVERHRNPENQREVLVEATKYAKEQLVVNPPLKHVRVKEAMESILTESERTELSRLLNKLVLGIENIEI